MMRVASHGIVVFALVLAAGLVGSCRARDGTRSANVPDVPVYPGAVLREAVTGDDLDPTEYYVISGVSADEVATWYAERMPRRGWSPSPGDDENFTIYHTRAGCYGFVGVFARDDGAVELQISQQRAGTSCLPYFTPDPNAGTE